MILRTQFVLTLLIVGLFYSGSYTKWKVYHRSRFKVEVPLRSTSRLSTSQSTQSLNLPTQTLVKVPYNLWTHTVYPFVSFQKTWRVCPCLYRLSPVYTSFIGVPTPLLRIQTTYLYDCLGFNKSSVVVPSTSSPTYPLSLLWSQILHFLCLTVISWRKRETVLCTFG